MYLRFKNFKAEYTLSTL